VEGGTTSNPFSFRFGFKASGGAPRPQNNSKSARRKGKENEGEGPSTEQTKANRNATNPVAKNAKKTVAGNPTAEGKMTRRKDEVHLGKGEKRA